MRHALLLVSMMLLATQGAQAGKHELPPLRWVMDSTALSHEYAAVLPDPNDTRKNRSLRRDIQKHARSQGLDLRANQIFIVSQPFSIAPPALTLGKDCKRKNNEDYCRTLDSIIDQERAAFNCPLKNYGALSTSGLSAEGIEHACVQNAVEAATNLAQAKLRGDRNLEWATAALQLNNNCKPPAFGQPGDCEYFDLILRDAFTAQVLNDLKSGPRPYETDVTARLIFDGKVISGSEPSGETPHPSIAMISGEFEVYLIDRPGQLVWRDRGARLGYSQHYAGTIPEFIREKVKGDAAAQCAAMKGTLSEDPARGAGGAHFGSIAHSGTTTVFYMASCEIL